ncbi:response regulator [Parachryseolinea silvisoli]|uniref:response regulator n=1 Tax=Parachryseolinea silvisoli TaxID=2873601 RepID=UPI002265BA90|nr:response regulator [Parachryseolinea silvisoli]MCD9015166.1 response regulator [Parachryseolinea silvisoli]
MTIFYADDDPDDHEVFAMLISSLHPDVKLVTARDGNEAIAILSNTTERFDAIFLDLNMPLMNGLECLRELRAMDPYKRTPIFLYSTTSEKTEVEMALSAGADKLFVKANFLHEMIDQLREALDLVSNSSLNTVLDIKVLHRIPAISPGAMQRYSNTTVTNGQ